MSGSKDIPSAVTGEVIGVVLAGGKSRRMGRDKAGLLHEGVTLRTIAERHLRDSGVAHVFISGPGGIPDTQPELGPLSGIASVAHRLKGARAMLVVPVDMPGLSSALLARLVAAEAPAAFEGYELPLLLPLDGRLDTALARTIIGTRSLHELLERLGGARLPVSENERAAFINLNTPEAWAEFGDPK